MSVSPDFVAYEARIAVVRALTATVAPDNKRALFDALAAASIQHVVISFDGSEGSGQIEGTQVWVSNKTTSALPDVEIPFAEVDWDGPVLTSQPRRVADVIETMAYAFLEETHDGWKIDDGAFGTFTFDVTARSIMLDHHTRYMTSDHSQHSFWGGQRVCGVTIALFSGPVVPVRLISEQHMLEDFGRIPSFANWVRFIRREPWMGRTPPLGGVTPAGCHTG